MVIDWPRVRIVITGKCSECGTELSSFMNFEDFNKETGDYLEKAKEILTENHICHGTKEIRLS